MDRLILAYGKNDDVSATFGRVEVGSTPGSLLFEDLSSPYWFSMNIYDMVELLPRHITANKVVASIKSNEMLKRSISFLESMNGEICLCGWDEKDPMMPSGEIFYFGYDAVKAAGIRMTYEEARSAMIGYGIYEDATERVRCERMKEKVFSGKEYDMFYGYRVLESENNEIVFYTVRGAVRYSLRTLLDKNPSHSHEILRYITCDNLESWVYADYDSQKLYIKATPRMTLSIDSVIELDFMEDIFPNGIEFDQNGERADEKPFDVVGKKVVLVK